MISHLFKLMWNRKKGNSLLIVEFFACFLVLFVAIYMAGAMMSHYFESVNYSYQNIYHFSVNSPDTEKQADQTRETLRRIKGELELWPEVEIISLTANTVPFLEAGNRDEKVIYKGLVSRAQRWEVDEHFHQLLKIPLLTGKWFSGKEMASLQVPIVITKAMEKEFFGESHALGKSILIEETQLKVIGVVDNFNVGKWTYSQSGYFTLANSNTEKLLPEHFMIRFKKQMTVREHEKLSKYFSQTQRNSGLTIHPGATLEQYQKIEKRSSVLPVILLSVVCGFLIINVIIGLFGILWQSIRYRRAEIGLRRAIGANAGHIYSQIFSRYIRCIKV